jgi:hypothetical protein
MEQREEQLGHLQRLADELSRRRFQAVVVTRDARPYVRVTNPESTDLTECVLCQRADDGTWCFWWPWRQPIGSVDDVETVVTKIMAVLRSVEGHRDLREEHQPHY